MSCNIIPKSAYNLSIFNQSSMDLNLIFNWTLIKLIWEFPKQMDGLQPYKGQK